MLYFCFYLYVSLSMSIVKTGINFHISTSCGFTIGIELCMLAFSLFWGKKDVLGEDCKDVSSWWFGSNMLWPMFWISL